MKKLLCLLLAVLCLCLTGCASEALDVTGEWYALYGFEAYGETTAEHPETLEELPEAMQSVPAGTQVVFRDVNDETIIVEMTYRGDTRLAFLHRTETGWAGYARSQASKVMSFKGGVGSLHPLRDEGSVTTFTYKLDKGVLTLRSDDGAIAYEGPAQRWDKDVFFWETGSDHAQYNVFIRIDTLLDDDLRLR